MWRRTRAGEPVFKPASRNEAVALRLFFQAEPPLRSAGLEALLDMVESKAFVVR
jgi:hypothetical protein